MIRVKSGLIYEHELGPYNSFVIQVQTFIKVLWLEIGQHKAVLLVGNPRFRGGSSHSIHLACPTKKILEVSVLLTMGILLGGVRK